jgi:hypothetical protein
VIRAACYVLAAACMLAALHRRERSLAALFGTALALNVLLVLVRLIPSSMLVTMIEAGLFLAWPAVLAGVTAQILTGVSPWAHAWWIWCVLLCLKFVYPNETRVELVGEVAAGAAGVVSAVLWFGSRSRPTRGIVAALALGLGQPLVVLGGAYRVDPVGAWDLHRVGYLVILGVVLGALCWPEAKRAAEPVRRGVA